MQSNSNNQATYVNLKSVRRSTSKSNIQECIISYLMLLPQIIGFCVFTIYPIIWVFRFAWFDYNGILPERFIGMENFINIFTNDIEFWKSLLNTLILTFGKLFVEMPLALILAVILHTKIKGRDFFRTMFYMPTIISVAVIGLIFSILFSSFNGVINELLLNFRFIQNPINWFGYKWTAMSVIMIASIWQSYGINMLFFLTGLQNIPKDIYECAEIDGANKYQQFFKITLPLLAPIAQIILMLSIIGTMKVTDLVLVLTNGQPAGQTEVVMTYVFKFFFNTGLSGGGIQAGYGSALGIVTSIILGLITILYFKITKKANDV